MECRSVQSKRHFATFILAGINRDEIPCRTTEVLFKRLKEEIIRLKDEGRVLIRFNELRESTEPRLSSESNWFDVISVRRWRDLALGGGLG